jgi:hypothetical protein
LKLPILGNLNLKELLILGGSALVVYHIMKMHSLGNNNNDDKVPAITTISTTPPTSPVPPFREMQRISGFSARESGGCGCGS